MSQIALKLTYARIALVPIFVLIFYLGDGAWRAVALALYIIACLTDYLDGWYARKYNETTKLGAFLDRCRQKSWSPPC